MNGSNQPTLRNEVLGYIIAYWQEANDGLHCLPEDQPGHTARELAYDYMASRYEDYIGDEYWDKPELADRLIAQSPQPVDMDLDRTGRLCEAFDHMFDLLWPETR